MPGTFSTLPWSSLKYLYQDCTQCSSFHIWSGHIFPVQSLLIRQSQVNMTTFQQLFIHTVKSCITKCRSFITLYILKQYILTSLKFTCGISTCIFSPDSLQTKIGGPKSSCTISNSALKYHKFGFSGNLGNNI